MNTQDEVLIGRTFIKEILLRDDILTKMFFATGQPYRYLGQYAAMLRRAGVKKTQIELLRYLNGIVGEIAAEDHTEFRKHYRWDEQQKRWIRIESVNG